MYIVITFFKIEKMKITEFVGMSFSMFKIGFVKVLYCIKVYNKILKYVVFFILRKNINYLWEE